MHEDLAFRGTASEGWAGAANGQLMADGVLKADSKHKRVLLTGATGFLGGAFLAHVRESLDRPIEWVLPVRGKDDADARRRVWRRLTRFVDEVTAARILDHARVVRADLSDPKSLSPELLDGVTHVLHLAANTSFISKTGVWEMNYEGTRKLAELARSIPTLQRFIYVGTAMICGDEPTNLVEEDSYPSQDAKHLVAYTASKSAAEQALKDEFKDLPLVVARPSVVIGHTQLGTGPSGSIFWVLRALERVRLLAGDVDAGLDIVPADYVAKCLDYLMFAPKLKHQTYHISAGSEARTKIRPLAKLMQAAQKEPRGVEWEDFTVIESAELMRYRTRMTEAFGRANGRRVHMSLGLYLRFCELNVTFDNSRIRSEGLPPPPSLLEYVDRCLTLSNDLSIVEQADDEI